MAQLLPGFVLNAPVKRRNVPARPAGNGLPPGFVLDAPVVRKAPVASTPAPREYNTAGKGDLGLGAGEVAPMTYVEDVGKSFVSGVGSGITGLLGLPRDIADLAQSGVEYAAYKMGLNGKAAGETFSTINPTSYLPSSSNFKQGAERVTGDFYQPHTLPGEFAQTTGEFAPSAVAGPGGVVRKVAMTVIPAIASEASGQATKGTNAEPYARAAGALLGGGASAGFGNNVKTVKQIAKNAPSHEAVKNQTSQMYRQLRDAGITYNGAAFDRYAQGIAQKLSKEGFRKAQAPRTADIVDMMAEQGGKNLDYNDLESIRKAASSILREGPAVSQTDKAAASIIMDSLDDFAQRAPMTTNGNIAVHEVEVLKKQARELARRNIIARDIEDMATKSETYVSGQQSGLKNQFASYLRSKKGKGLTAQERQAFLIAAKGTTPQNLLNMLGRFGVDPTRMGNIASMLPAAGAGAAYYNDQPALAAALLGVGTGAKFLGRNSSMKNAKKAKDVVLAGRAKQSLVSSQAAERSKKIAVRRLIAIENSADARSQNKPLKGASHYGRGDLIPNR